MSLEINNQFDDIFIGFPKTYKYSKKKVILNFLVSWISLENIGLFKVLPKNQFIFLRFG
jgi:hypothetical protein